jgi:hypothetical protein
MESDIDAIVSEVAEGDGNLFPIDRGLVVLRNVAGNRHQAWLAGGKPTGAAIALPSGASPALKSQARALAAAPFDGKLADAIGWALLEDGKRHEAQRFFLHALWVDPDDADAWFGYGLGQANLRFGVGALTMARLLSTDPAAWAQRRRAVAGWGKAEAGVPQEELADALQRAEELAAQLRPRIAPGVLPAQAAAATGDVER